MDVLLDGINMETFLPFCEVWALLTTDESNLIAMIPKNRNAVQKFIECLVAKQAATYDRFLEALSIHNAQLVTVLRETDISEVDVIHGGEWAVGQLCLRSPAEVHTYVYGLDMLLISVQVH